MLPYAAVQNSNLDINSALDFAGILFFCSFVFARCLTLTCQLKTHFLLITFPAKACFSWQINKTVLKNNILLKLPIRSSKRIHALKYMFYLWNVRWKSGQEVAAAEKSDVLFNF